MQKVVWWEVVKVVLYHYCTQQRLYIQIKLRKCQLIHGGNKMLLVLSACKKVMLMLIGAINSTVANEAVSTHYTWHPMQITQLNDCHSIHLPVASLTWKTLHHFCWLQLEFEPPLAIVQLRLVLWHCSTAQQFWRLWLLMLMASMFNYVEKQFALFRFGVSHCPEI